MAADITAEELGAAGMEWLLTTWQEPTDGCWATLTASGLPERLYPGFWQNAGRCCGTAAVLSLANDRIVERGDGHDFAAVLAADIAARATIDVTGARWSNVDHLSTPGNLEPHNGWAHGNAGITRALLRYARVTTGRDHTYAYALPDQPPATGPDHVG